MNECFSVYNTEGLILPEPVITDIELQECFGINGGNIIEAWGEGLCASRIHNYMYNGDILDSDKYKQIQDAVYNMIYRYYQNKTPSISGQIGYTQQDTIIADMCSSRDYDGNQGICTPILSKLCQGCPRKLVENNVAYTRLCGCFTDHSFDISRECDSLCDKKGYVATLRDETLKTPIFCEAQNICVITDVNFVLNNTEGGNVNIKQRCDGCTKENPCKCVLDKTFINQLQQISTRNNVNFNEICHGENSACLIYDPTTGNNENVSCEINVSKSIPKEPNSSYRNIIFICVGLILLTILVLGIMVYSLK